MLDLKVFGILIVVLVLIEVSYQQSSDDFLEDNLDIETKNKCVCVPYFQCDENNTIITNGQSLFQDRMDSIRIICRGGKFKGHKVCCKPPDSLGMKEPVGHPVIRECGSRGALFTLRVYADEDESVTVDGEFPWIAAVYMKKTPEKDFKYRCSGSLIHPQVILTVEHHVKQKDPNLFKVLMHGKADLPLIGQKSENERNVKEIVHHPDYKQSSMHYDAALLILDRPFNISKRVNAICLPPEGVNFTGRSCIVAGWGKSLEQNNTKLLKKVSLPIVPREKCQEELRQELEYDYDLHSSFMCAGGEEGKDACEGDGGGPLVCQFDRSKRFYQLGIVSWGIGCGSENVPGVYTDVSVIRNWIEMELSKRNFTVD